MIYTTAPTYARFTMAVTNVVTTFAVLAAPGAGLRYRIVAIKAAMQRTAAAQIIDCTLLNNAALLWVWDMNQPNQMDWGGTIFPAPGVLIDTNIPINITATSSIAGPTNVFVSIGYFTDSV